MISDLLRLKNKDAYNCVLVRGGVLGFYFRHRVKNWTLLEDFSSLYKFSYFIFSKGILP